MNSVITVCVICLTVIVVAILVLLGILLYNQMLATNEVNKRLLLITKESIDKERSTQEELQASLLELERTTQQEAHESNSLNGVPFGEIEEESFDYEER